MNEHTRRRFLKAAGLSVLPSLSAAFPSVHSFQPAQPPLKDTSRVFLVYDGPLYKPTEFIAKLQEINKAGQIARDFYGEGGSVDALIRQFIAITGKEAAIYVTSGTLANQLAISVLSGENSKVFVQETSHVYRDEADAAQTIFNKRLIPLAKGQPYFTADELQEAIAYHTQGEAFATGIGVVSIENPVRRCDGRSVPVEEIRKIAALCRKSGYKLHLDGARLYMASAYSGVSIAEYASYFDTVYISLYKYLGASGGAILCGDKAVIDKMQHLIKIHGGAVFGNWANAAMALHHLEKFESRFQSAIKKAKELFTMLDQLPEIKTEAIENGTNISKVNIDVAVDSSKFNSVLRDKHHIEMAPRREDGSCKIMVNETLLRQDNQRLFEAFKEALKHAKA